MGTNYDGYKNEPVGIEMSDFTTPTIEDEEVEEAVSPDTCPVCNKPQDECECKHNHHKPPFPPNPGFPIPSTPFYHLPQFGPRDLSDWFVNMNLALMSIDAALHNMDIKIMRYPSKLEEQIKKLRCSIQDINNMVVTNNIDIDELKDKTDATNTIVEQVQATIATQQLQIDNLSTRVQTSELNVAAMRTKVANLDASFSRVSAEFKLLKQDFDKLNVTFKEMEDKQDVFDKRIDDIEDNVEEFKQNYEQYKSENDINIGAINIELQDFQDQISEEKRRNDVQDGRIQNNSSRIDTLANDLKATQTKHDSDIISIRSDIVDLQREEAKLSDHINRVEENLSETDDRMATLREEHDELKANHDTLQDTVQNLVDTEVGHNTRLTALEDDLSALTERVSDNEKGISNHTTLINSLTNDVSTLMDKADATDTTINEINDTLADHTDQLVSLQEDVASNSATMTSFSNAAMVDIKKNKNDIVALQAEIAANSYSLTTFNNRISALETNSAALSTNVSSLNEQVQNQAAELAGIDLFKQGTNNKFTQVNNKITALEDAVENLEPSGGTLDAVEIFNMLYPSFDNDFNFTKDFHFASPGNSSGSIDLSVDVAYNDNFIRIKVSYAYVNNSMNTGSVMGPLAKSILEPLTNKNTVGNIPLYVPGTGALFGNVRATINDNGNLYISLTIISGVSTDKGLSFGNDSIIISRAN